ncbi:TPA: helix-turn-helix domain-containing protein [Elizabethkingia meningoseptica]|uniref:helix-turn-helix domain-containing protein n=1 Tax=Elizabethkingia meningoseptica TaxID=238 RepID=UPI0022F1C440|nr:XRE family transcriptional regulator [Elizabethkingia meningoseptica]EJK5329849.1 ImmA/IrrE family metallo-endopeptidase [Elizabethkingia meningoseptica]WBS73600.1 XRE family transcriptional regulator [Elizabethkingia meningoseptica]HAY3561406.1 helix-turn-helix domain-containing protein [Elizabethkingia meningoseptica]
MRIIAFNFYLYFMNIESDYIRTIFGVKLKQLRQQKKWSLQEISEKTGMSKSYLNEIEKGKKYPKHDKILALAEALDCNFDELVSIQLDKNLAPIGELMQKDFFRELPLELFGINKNSLINIVSEAPKKVNAFINTLIEIAQTYNFDKDHFYLSVLRSFQELYNNYFPEVEEKATDFIRKHNLTVINIQILENILKEDFGYHIQYENYEKQGHLKHLRSLFSEERKILSINQKLEEQQKLFILAKEIGFQFLQLQLRPNTYTWVKFTNFDSLVNNFYASYFAGCLLIPKDQLIQETRNLFQQKEWKNEYFDQLIENHTQSPETLFYRLTNILPEYFGIKDLFYLCFVKRKNSDKIDILKELHLNRQQAPHANTTNEHYCRRWIAIKNMLNLSDSKSLTSVQISEYENTGLHYLVISTSQKNPFADGNNRSYCLGILLNPETTKQLKFLKNVSRENVGITCESCSVKDCEVRQASAIKLEKQELNESIQLSVEEKLKEMKSVSFIPD